MQRRQRIISGPPEQEIEGGAQIERATRAGKAEIGGLFGQAKISVLVEIEGETNKQREGKYHSTWYSVVPTRQERQRDQKQEGRIAELEVDLAEKPSKQPQNLNQIHSFSLLTPHHYNYSSTADVVPVPQFPTNPHPMITHNLSRLSRRAAIASIVPCVRYPLIHSSHWFGKSTVGNGCLLFVRCSL